MAIEPEYADLFSDTVFLVPSASVDAYGKRVYTASAASVAAHIVYEVMLTRDEQGREVTQTGKAYLYGVPTVDTSYRIILSDGASPVLLGVDERWDEDGPHHTVVRFGKG